MIARASQFISLSLAFGLPVGVLDGLLRTLPFEQARDVRWVYLADGVERWSLLGLLVVALWMLVFRAAQGRVAVATSARLATLCALAAPFLILLKQINQALLPGKWEPVSLATNAALLVIGLVLTLLVSRFLLAWQEGSWSRRQPRILAAGLLSLGLIGLHVVGHARQRDPAPDVLVILLDVLRADHLGCYGYDRPTSPNIDRLAADSVVFENLISASTYTKTSVASVFTGLDPCHHGVYTGTDGGGTGEVKSDVLSGRFTTLAESLYAECGMNTAAWVQNGHIRDYLGYAQGFTFYADQPGNVETITRAYGAWAKEWAERTRSFSYLHILDLHGPYDPPPPFQGEFGPTGGLGFELNHLSWSAFKKKVARKEVVLSDEDIQRLEARYDESILYVDHWVGRILAGLKARGRYDDTLIVVMSDHGEGFWEHGFISHSTIPYEELIRVPLIVKLPKSRGAGRRVDRMVGHVDILPTLLEFAGASAAGSYDGESFLPLLLDPTAEAEPRTRIIEYMGIIGVRTDRWMYIARPRNRRELYDLEADPDQLQDCIDAHAEVAAAFEGAVEFVIGERRKASAERVTLDQETVRSLEALGYL